MLQAYNSSGIQVLDVHGQLGWWPASAIEDWASDVWDAAKDGWDATVDGARAIKNAGIWLANKTCDTALSPDVVKYVVYLRTAIPLLVIAAPLDPSGVTATTLATAKTTLMVYEKTCAACNVLLPPEMPPAPGADTPPPADTPPATVTNPFRSSFVSKVKSGVPTGYNPGPKTIDVVANQEQIDRLASSLAAQEAERQRLASLIGQRSSLIAPWYKRGTSYAAAGGLLAALGLAVYLAKR